MVYATVCRAMTRPKKGSNIPIAMLSFAQVIVNLIGATTTQTGLRVQADLDTDFYPTKVKVTDKQLATVDLHPHRFHGEWNYTIKHQIASV